MQPYKVKKEEYLLEYSSMENEELKKSLANFPDEIRWMSEVFVLIQSFERELSNINPKFRTSVDLANIATKDILLCFLFMLRRHTASAYGNMRTALEAATFINNIRGDPNKALSWVKKEFLNQDDKNYKKLLYEGRKGKLGEELKKRFNFASEQSHSNLFRLLLWKSEKFSVEDKMIYHRYSFFDEDDKWFIGHMHHQIGSAFLIMRVLGEVFHDHLSKTEFPTKLDTKNKEYILYLSQNLERVLFKPENPF